MLSFLKSFIFPDPPRAEFKTWNMADHKSWGNAIQWSDPGKTLVGWLPFRSQFQKGDLVRCEMQSGKTGKYLVKDVTYYCDPPDMFYADVEGLEYAED